MKKLFYPALFHKAEEGGFWITFPDFPECMSQGDDMQEAYEMAFDALGLAIVSRQESKEELPIPSEPDAIPLEPDSFCVAIEFDLATYQRKHNSKAVKKTLSIPEWLNQAALEMNINFSQVLQDALIQKVGNR
jgi:antitoxin HicB